MTDLLMDPSKVKSAVGFIDEGVNAGEELKATIARSFHLTEVSEAHRFMEANSQIGKIILYTTES